MKKIRLGILFGGKSAEHEVSLQSAKNVLDALDKTKFEPVLIGIDKTGTWHLNDQSTFLLNAGDPALIKLNQTDQSVTLQSGHKNNELVNTVTNQSAGTLDVIFPVLHGPLGEDGTIQGLLRLADLPFVGAGVLGSAVGMDKDVMKRLLRDAGIPIANFIAYGLAEQDKISFVKVKAELGLPCFVKPANMGSSVGVSKVTDESTFKKAIENAFLYDTKILIEEAIVGDEVEVAILGNDLPKASLPGKVIVQADFYSYEAKYIDENGAVLEIPADLPPKTIEDIQKTAIKAFKVLACEGMARVDMFVIKDGRVIVNEINTIPGFTKISMYPKLWEVSGLSYTDLITDLIELALERYDRQKRLRSSYV